MPDAWAASWGVDPWTLATIGAVALATFACRGGGYWLFRQMRPSVRVRAALGYVPGALFVSYVVPALVAGGPQQWVGAVVTAGVMLASGNLSLAILVGTAGAWAVWSLNP